MQDKKIMIFYKSFYESIKNLDAKKRLECLESIIKYAIYNEIPNKPQSDIVQMYFFLNKPIIDAYNERRKANTANGKKGGAPLCNKNASKEGGADSFGNDSKKKDNDIIEYIKKKYPITDALKELYKVFNIDNINNNNMLDFADYVSGALNIAPPDVDIITNSLLIQYDLFKDFQELKEATAQELKDSRECVICRIIAENIENTIKGR